MPTTGRLGTAVFLPLLELSFLFLGVLLGFGNIAMPLMTHDHNWRGSLVERSITGNH